MFKDYLKGRLAERDTHVVVLSALYTVIRTVVPIEYQVAVDSIAGILGAAYIGTPIRKLK